MLDEVTTKTVAFTKIRINNKNQYTYITLQCKDCFLFDKIHLNDESSCLFWRWKEGRMTPHNYL